MTKGVVVVLGPTGRNFAAGMTGGFAYVFDETGEFSSVWCNRTSVGLEQLEPEDAARVQDRIRRHQELTGSWRAKHVLDHWDALQSQFIKVFPHEYRRVLENAASSAGAERRVAHG